MEYRLVNSGTELLELRMTSDKPQIFMRTSSRESRKYFELICTRFYLMGLSEFWRFDITSATRTTVVSDDRGRLGMCLMALSISRRALREVFV